MSRGRFTSRWPPAVTVLVALALLGGLWFAARKAWRDVTSYRSAEGICDLVRGGELPQALERAGSFEGTPTQEQRVAQCLCVGELPLGRSGPCLERLETLLASPEHGSWLPIPPLTSLLVEERRKAGDVQGAADLVSRATRRLPPTTMLLYQELELRPRVEAEPLVLDEMAARLPGLPPEVAEPVRRAIAARHAKRGEWDEALEVLGDGPPRTESPAEWRKLRALMLGGAGNHADLRAFLGIEGDASSASPEAKALYGYVLSAFPLTTQVSSLDLILEALERADEIEDEDLLRTAYIRAIRGAAGQRPDLLVELQERAERRFGEDWNIPGREVERFAEVAASGPGGTEVGRLRFVGDDLRKGDRLLVSPSPDEPDDAPYVEYPVEDPARPVQVERAPGAHPVRWVLRDATGRTCGSGSVWPVRGEEETVPVTRRPCLSAAPPHEGRGEAGDGHRRVFVVVLDSADWRIVEYLRARGEMPLADFLREEGLHGVLHSDPPYTAAALAQITWPSRPGISSFWGLLHKMGAEIGSNNFVGRNPAAALEWLLADTRDIFQVVGAGPLRAANMLRSFGALRLGRHAEVTGPEGRVDRLENLPGPRGVSETELRELGLDEPVPEGRAGELLGEIAGDLDALSALVERDDLDLVLLRVAAFDILHHGEMFDLGRAGQDDAAVALPLGYRYADRRLARIHRGLDADDVWVVMSDHGAEGALQHSDSAVFLADGPALQPGRLSGRPHLLGLPLFLAELLGIETDWPSTGLEDRIVDPAPPGP